MGIWTKTLEKLNKGRNSQVHISSVFFCVQHVCVYMHGMRVLRDTYAPRGFPDSGHSSVACAALWTKLMWRYPAPGMYNQSFC